MAWSIIDLSSITDHLIDLLTDAFAPSSPVWIENGGTIKRFTPVINGAMPESARDDGGCTLSLYLLHVSQDKFHRNAPVSGPLAQLNRKHPLSLDLYYLLTAYAGDTYTEEQQAMSIALRCFYENPIVRKTGPPQDEEYTLTMEVETADEMSRLWQALNASMRLSVVYKVSIVFITPSQVPTVPGPKPVSVGLAVVPKVSPALPAQLYGAAVRESFIVSDTAGGADSIEFVLAPGLARPGDDLIVTGAGLDKSAFAKAFLTKAGGGTEHDITAWRQGAASGSDLRLRLPATVGTAPADSPAPGVYMLTVGSDMPPVRSNATPVSVAARISKVAVPPKLEPVGGFYKVEGAGFTTGSTDVFLDTVPLTAVAGPDPGDGQFVIDASEQSFRFKPPAALPSDRYHLRVRVNQIDSPPSWYIEI
jgi:hypothetical protein